MALYSNKRTMPTTHLGDQQDTVMSQTSDTVTISHEAKNAEQTWQNIATKYDVRNISRTERGAMVNDLVQNGFISNEVALHMAAPLSTSEVAHDKTDFLGTMKSSLESNNSAKLSANQLKTKLEMVEVLEKLKLLQ